MPSAGWNLRRQLEEEKEGKFSESAVGDQLSGRRLPQGGRNGQVASFGRSQRDEWRSTSCGIGVDHLGNGGVQARELVVFCVTLKAGCCNCKDEAGGKLAGAQKAISGQRQDQHVL